MPLSIAPPTTDIEIVSTACALCGKKTFNTIDGGGPFAQDAAAFYGTLVSAELSSNRWKFALDYQATGILTTLTPTLDNWNYYWAFPADLIMLHRVDPYVPYTVIGRKLLTSGSQSLTAVYSKNVPVTKWPPVFSMYIIYALADMLSHSVTNSDRMVARIQEGLKMWQSRALFADGQSTQPRLMRNRPYQDVRNGFNRGR